VGFVADRRFLLVACVQQEKRQYEDMLKSHHQAQRDLRMAIKLQVLSIAANDAHQMTWFRI
jgi:hypothetical protein